MIAGHEARLLVYVQREDGSFSRSANPLKLLASEPDPPSRNTFTLADVDGDRRADLLLTRSPTSIGLFETFAAHHGTVFRAEAHTRRLVQSARELLLSESLRARPLAEAVELTLKRNGLEVITEDALPGGEA